MPFDLAELVERAWLAIGTGQSEAEKQLFRDELAFLADDARERASALVAGMPAVAHLLQKTADFEIETDGAGFSYGRVSLASQPSLLTSHIRRVEHLSEDDPPVLTVCHRLATPDQLYSRLPRGRIWWALRDRRIETVADDGTTERDADGSSLTGSLRVHASFIGEIADFAAYPQLEPVLVDQLRLLAQVKLDARRARAVAEALS
jgi:hypothetical protein